MARNKYPEETIERILDVSLKLFLEKGYEHTTIQDIVNALQGLSKGAIYHHFKSKDEIVDAVFEKVFSENKWFLKLKEDKTLNGLQKVQKLFINSIADNTQIQMLPITSSLLKNPKFLAKQIEQTLTRGAELFKELIEEGIADGSIKNDSPKELAEVILLLTNVWWNPAISKVTREEWIAKITFLKKLLDGIGLPFIKDEAIESSKQFYDLAYGETNKA
ncbi:TetR/AcrR family transcriptional regulator [Clostridium tetanomorphum]|uniref:TetR/AcrR family transcriptional regulator n=1 Tax=Clostridium tetanomorphum TaxID=1553 RepID=A0A923EDR2_CLOTT|nr:TetR/AcrR family transcriptional regulator [Clostridium tetanomorphum]MBC2398810.1 TetR/AcrR family transcriptional regulator [Clostridium tetanomorphum]NRZ96824.1 AcrR family transcriptional regulator [Clostridium tetanomorphum]